MSHTGTMKVYAEMNILNVLKNFYVVWNNNISGL